MHMIDQLPVNHQMLPEDAFLQELCLLEDGLHRFVARDVPGRDLLESKRAEDVVTCGGYSLRRDPASHLLRANDDSQGCAPYLTINVVNLECPGEVYAVVDGKEDSCVGIDGLKVFVELLPADWEEIVKSTDGSGDLRIVHPPQVVLGHELALPKGLERHIPFMQLEGRIDQKGLFGHELKEALGIEPTRLTLSLNGSLDALITGAERDQ